MNTTFPLAIRALAATAFAITALFTAPEAKAELPTEFYGFALGASVTEARQACEAQGDVWEWRYLYKIESLNERIFECHEHIDFKHVGPELPDTRQFHITVDVETGRIRSVEFTLISQRDVRSEYEHAAAVLLELCGEPTHESSTELEWRSERSEISISNRSISNTGPTSWSLHWGRRYQ